MKCCLSWLLRNITLHEKANEWFTPFYWVAEKFRFPNPARLCMLFSSKPSSSRIHILSSWTLLDDLIARFCTFESPSDCWFDRASVDLYSSSSCLSVFRLCCAGLLLPLLLSVGQRFWHSRCCCFFDNCFWLVSNAGQITLSIRCG